MLNKHSFLWILNYTDKNETSLYVVRLGEESLI